MSKKPNVEIFVENVFGVSCDSINRHFINTTDKTLWYRVNHSTATMYVPGMNVLRVNQQEVTQFIGAVESFIKHDLDDPIFDWDNLKLAWYNDHDNIVIFLKSMIGYRGEPFKVAVDIETRNLSWDDNRLLSIGFALSEDECVALSHIDPSLYPMLSMALNNPDIRYVWHNGKFDCTKLKYLCNIDARVDEDTMLQHFIKISEKKGTHDLKTLGPIYLQAPQWDDELNRIKKEYCRKNKVKVADFTYDLLGEEVLIPYMQRDCIATLRLNRVFDELKEEGTDWIYRKVIEASNVFARLELNGVLLDIEHTNELEKELREELAEAEQLIKHGVDKYWDAVKYAKQTGAAFVEAFNINSPKQLKWLLSTATGMTLESTDAATIDKLVELSETGTVRFESCTTDLLQGIARSRKASKYLDTYVTAMKKQVCRDGRIRGSYKLHGTETGRLSSNNPNMQNIPRNKKVKNIFKAKPGYKLVQLDYSQAELRVLGVLSGDPFLIQSYVEDKDLHANVALKIFGENFTSEQRTQCKTINFGIAYGRGSGAIAQAFHMSKSEAQKIIDDWFRAMPLVEKYIKGQRAAARRGDRQQTIFGRVRHYVINEENMFHVENEYINTPIQSIASDLTLFSLIEIDKWLRSMKLDARIVITVHDSIVLEVKDDPELVQQVAKHCQGIMAEVPQRYIHNCPLPFKADVEVGYSWGKLGELE